MNFSYTPLFDIELLHEYFLNRKCKDVKILPTRDCVEISRRMNIQFREVENRLIAFIKENDEHEPFCNSGNGKFYRNYYNKTVFRFYLLLQNPQFLNYTNISLSY